AIFDSGQRVNESDHALVGIRADQDAAAVYGDRQNRRRHDIGVAGPPDAALQIDDLGEFLERGQIAVGDHNNGGSSRSDCMTGTSSALARSGGRSPRYSSTARIPARSAPSTS